MKTLIVDIETIGEDWDKIDTFTQENMSRWIKETSKTEDQLAQGMKELKEGLGFSPLTGEIVAIGVMDYQSEKRAVYYHAKDEEESVEDGVVYKPMAEAQMLVKFWEVAQSFQTFVTFNGYAFDAPYLAIRSAIHGIKPSVNLLSNRFLSMQRGGVAHVDLQEQLSFYGAMRKKGSLHLWSRAFGIESSKSEKINGHEVANMYKEGRFMDIARYNAADLTVTAELYTKWTQFVKLS